MNTDNKKEQTEQCTIPSVVCSAEIMNAYGDYWDKVKNYVDKKGWCKIDRNADTLPGKCGMTDGSYQMTHRHRTNNYMGWTHFRPIVLKHIT